MSVLKSVQQVRTPKEFFENRESVRHGFLNQYGYAHYDASIVAEDWAARRYWRLRDGNASRILMESAPDDHHLATPGHKIADTVKIASWLRSVGVHVPAVEAVDEAQGYVLMEDLGQKTLPLDRDAYGQAADVLKSIQSAYDENHLNLPAYKGGAVDMNKSRLIRWYLPLSRVQRNEGTEVTEFDAIWEKIESKLPLAQNTFVHVDYHAGNIMWLPHESGIKRCGLLDFQGAHYGSSAYDLVNLLEDIRRDVPDDLKTNVKESFCRDMNVQDRDEFEQNYTMLMTGFYSRIAGQLIRLYALKNDEKHLMHLPRVIRVLDDLLEQDVFFDLRNFVNDVGLNLKAMPDICEEKIKALVTPDF